LGRSAADAEPALCAEDWQAYYRATGDVTWAYRVIGLAEACLNEPGATSKARLPCSPMLTP